jgi:hypothetical protein
MITSKVVSTMAVDRIDSRTLQSALTQILLLSCSLAQAYKMQLRFPFTIRVFDRAGNCFMTMEAEVNKASRKSRVLEIDLPKSGVGMPIFVLLQDRRGKRVKQLVQRRSRKTVPRECW